MAISRDQYKNFLKPQRTGGLPNIFGTQNIPQASESAVNPKQTFSTGTMVNQPQDPRTAYKKMTNKPLPSTPAPMKSETQLAQEELDKFNAAKNRGLEGINQKVIPLEFQTGQKAALERNAALTGNELETRLARLQAADAAEAEKNKPIQLGEGESLFDPVTGKVIYKAPKTYAPTSGVNSLFGNAKLTTGQKNDIADMLVVQRQVDELERLGKEYGGYVGAGPASGFNQASASLTGQIRPGAQDIRNNIGQIKGFIAKLRGGTSFTPNEQKLLDSYTPKAGDSDPVINSKLKSLKQYINDKIESTTLVAGGSYSPQNGSGIDPQVQELINLGYSPEQINQIIGT